MIAAGWHVVESERPIPVNCDSLVVRDLERIRSALLARDLAAQQNGECTCDIAISRRVQPAFNAPEAAVEDDRYGLGPVPEDLRLAKPRGGDRRADLATLRYAIERKRSVGGRLGSERTRQLAGQQKPILSGTSFRWLHQADRDHLRAGDWPAVLVVQPAADRADGTEDDREPPRVNVIPVDAAPPADPPVANARAHAVETPRLGTGRSPGARKHEFAPVTGRRRRDRLGCLPFAADEPDLGPRDSNSGFVHDPPGEVLSLGSAAARELACQCDEADHEDRLDAVHRQGSLGMHERKTSAV